jgi:hypothetical protein
MFDLINLGSTHSYITLRIVEECSLKRKKHVKYLLVQLAIGAKRKVSEVVKECPVELNGFLTIAQLNILPLGSYDSLIGMDGCRSIGPGETIMLRLWNGMTMGEGL